MSPHQPTTTTRSTGEAAQILDVDRKTVLNWIHAGMLDAEPQQNGNRIYYRVTQASLDRMCTKLKKIKKADQPSTG